MKKPVAVFGLGISNLAVIRALLKRGMKVLAWDDNAEAREKAAKLGGQIQELNKENLKTCEYLILAPGIPLNHPVVRAAEETGTEMLCDIELLHRFGISCKTVGITGTNGKSTTTALIGHVLKEAGREAIIGGNIGAPVFDLDLPGKEGILVLELSSFQLDLCPTFRPDIAILTNITPDHLDRHFTMENYAAAKAKMFEGEGAAVITGTDTYSQKIKKDTRRETVPLPDGLEETACLKGAHNIQNMQAAYAVCKHLGLSDEEIKKGFESFPGLLHRQFLVRSIGKTAYINDSKATNAEAASKALASYSNIYWIAGGLAKEGGLEDTKDYLSSVKKAFLIGDAAEDFAAFLKEQNIPHEISADMEKAVKTAHAEAQKEGAENTVLLAPACASYDQYKNFEMRGDHFTKLVEGLPA